MPVWKISIFSAYFAAFIAAYVEGKNANCNVLFTVVGEVEMFLIWFISVLSSLISIDMWR